MKEPVGKKCQEKPYREEACFLPQSPGALHEGGWKCPQKIKTEFGWWLNLLSSNLELEWF
jgi:hypothetical protein